MGLADYYRRFIEGFSKIVAPLTLLTRKDQPFTWTDKCEESFQELKRRLTSAPILVIPNMGKPFEVYCDASHLGLGCVLMQEKKDLDVRLAFSMCLLSVLVKFLSLSSLTK